MSARRRAAFILPVVLVVIGLLAVTLASFVFFVNAEMAGIQAHRDAQQARLTAESGLEEVISVIRGAPDDPSAWYDVPDRFRNALVWAETYVRDQDPVRQMGNRQEILAMAVPPVAWRYSVVAPNLDGPPQTIRFGITPESGKLNLNTASDGELERLLTPLLLEMRVQNAPELVAALLDWRDEDSDIRPGGAEDEYYTNLIPAYTTKNGPLDTLEEILQIKGWTAAMLYGEDTNRNGLLDANEDDGDASFPYYDNADGILNYGVAPYVTVWSREPGAAAQPQGQGDGQPQPQDGANQDNGTPDQQPQQPADESGAGVPPASPGGADILPSKRGAGGADAGGSGAGGAGVSPAKPDTGGKPGKSQARQSNMNPNEKPPDKPPAPAAGAPPTKVSPGGKPPLPAAGQPPPKGPSGGQAPGLGSSRPPGPNVGKPPPVGRPPLDGLPPRAGQPPQLGVPGQPQQPGAGGQPMPGQPPAVGGQQPSGTDTTQPTTPVTGGTGGQSAGTGGMRAGLVNVNTAPLRVLQALDGMPAGGAEAIIAVRQGLSGDVLESPDWIVSSGAVDGATYDQIKDRITTRSLQFHVEIVGYGDHTKLARRYEWIIEMRGSVAQVLYHRDLTGLGFAWPIDDETTIVKGK